MKLLLKISIQLFIINNLCYKQFTQVEGEACEDFYEYACANYSQNNPDDNYNDVMEKLDYEMNKKLFAALRKAFLNHLYDSNYQTYYDKVGIYFEACCNNTNENIQKYLQEVKPGKNLDWPLMGYEGQWLKVKGSFDFWSFLGQLQSYGLNNVIINHQITRHKDNTFDILLNPAVVSQMDDISEEALVYILKALQINATESVLKKLNDYKIELETKTESYTRNQKTSLGINYKDLPTYLKSYLKNLLGHELENGTLVSVENAEYFDFTMKNSRSRFRLESLCNYLMIKFIWFVGKDKTRAFSPLACFKDLRKNFELAINFLTFEYFFHTQYVQLRLALNQLVNKLKVVIKFLFDINFLNLSNEEINFLKLKLKALDINIGNLPANCSLKTVQDYYETVPNLASDNYYKNHLLLLQHRFKNSLNNLKNLSFYINNDKNLAIESSPFYVREQNMVVLPWSSLQPPLFHDNYTLKENLPLFGFVLAHEFAHAFDLAGLNYNSERSRSDYSLNIINNLNFRAGLDCLEKDMESQILNERLADLFAVRVIYITYLHFYGDTPEAEGKKFFLNMAQFFCSKKIRPSNTHDADNIRLQFIVKNYAPFAQTFGCKEGSPMNPKKKCRVY